MASILQKPSKGGQSKSPNLSTTKGAIQNLESFARCFTRMVWQKTSGYNWQALVEADISRFKRVVGDGLRSRSDRRRATEVAIAVNALNRMLELGRPGYVRLA